VTPAESNGKAGNHAAHVNGVYAAAVKINGRRWPDGVSAAPEAPEESDRTVVVIAGSDSDLVRQATARGVAPLLTRAETVEEALALALRQMEEQDRLKRLMHERAQLERAKGILMERHKVNERDAHERMRRHARKLNLKLGDVADAVVTSYLLLPTEDL
jgi:AmiR/NasT family two-component response regulator